MTEITPILEFAQSFAGNAADGTMQVASDYMTSMLDRLVVFTEAGNGWGRPHMAFID